jgi:hypothetical protein
MVAVLKVSMFILYLIILPEDIATHKMGHNQYNACIEIKKNLHCYDTSK